MLPKSPAGDVLSIRGNSGNAGDTGFAGEMESALGHPFPFMQKTYICKSLLVIAE